MNMIEFLKKSFDDVDRIFLEYYFPHKIESKLTWMNEHV